MRCEGGVRGVCRLRRGEGCGQVKEGWRKIRSSHTDEEFGNIFYSESMVSARARVCARVHGCARRRLLFEDGGGGAGCVHLLFINTAFTRNAAPSPSRALPRLRTVRLRE